jgi:uncharacterized protein involved in exopolysaccharide biosynthesis
MARTQPPKDLLSRFADLGEEAMNRLADVPGANRLVEMTNQSRQRLDEIQKRLRGLDELEQRVNALEKRLEALEKKPAARPATPAKPRVAAVKKPATPKKPPA